MGRLERAGHNCAGLVGEDSRKRRGLEGEGVAEEGISDLQTGFRNSHRGAAGHRIAAGHHIAVDHHIVVGLRTVVGEGEARREDHIHSRRLRLHRHDILGLGSVTC